MRTYTVFAMYNTRDEAMALGWMPGDRLRWPAVKSVGTMTVRASSPEEAADVIYRAMNHVDGSPCELVGTDRSMSVGDVAFVMAEDQEAADLYACRAAGWKRISR